MIYENLDNKFDVLVFNYSDLLLWEKTYDGLKTGLR